MVMTGQNLKLIWRLLLEKTFFCTTATTRTAIEITILVFLEYPNWANEIDNR